MLLLLFSFVSGGGQQQDEIRQKENYIQLFVVQTVKRSLFLSDMSTVRKKYFFMSCAALLMTSVAAEGAMATALTASTSLTVVHVTELAFNSVDITRWEGDWPNDPNDLLIPESQEVYLNNVYFTPTHMSWETTPYTLPYPVFPNTMTGMVAAVWSKDKGKTYTLGSWDYLRNTAHSKGIEAGMPDCWMGTLVHSICDRKVGECNGRNKSNLYFTEYPSGNNSCWGTL